MTIGPDDPVRLVMHGDVVSVDQGTTLREVAELMAAEEVGSVVVVEEGQVIGIVSERDVVVALGEGVDPDVISAGNVMSAGPMGIDPDDTVRYAAERMLQAGVRHLPVLGTGNPLGMVSARDLFAALTETVWAT
jgi:CBS domain-containing protein